MANMYEAGEILSRIKRIVDGAKNQPIGQTPDGRPPVYWPITIYGKTGMMEDKRARKYDHDPRPSTPKA